MTKPNSRLPPIKTCPACFRVWCSGQRICLECGFEFYVKRQKEAEKNDEPQGQTS